MAVGSSRFIKLAKLSFLPSWGVALVRISASDVRASNSANFARWERWWEPGAVRTATC